MISKFPGKCKTCSKPYDQGEEIHWTREDGAHHPKCWDGQRLFTGADEQAAIAEKLGYRPHAEWSVLLLPPAANGNPAWWDRAETSGLDAVRPVPTSDEVETITGLRGTQEY